MVDPATTETAPEWVRTLNIWTDEGLHRDPYPRFAELRRTCPVTHSDTFGGYWVVSGYDAMRQVFQDPGSFSNVTLTIPPFDDPLAPRIPDEVDPPEHTRYRQILSSFFSPQKAEALAPYTRATVRRLLEAVSGETEFEFMEAIAHPLPFHVVMTMFGIHERDHQMIIDLDKSGMRDAHSDIEVRKKVQEEIKVKVAEYLKGLIEERMVSAAPSTEDLLGHLVAARYDGVRPLTLDEMVRMSVFILNAGLHTTTNVLGNSLVYLSEHPDARDELVANPDLIPSALEELMRYESIVSVARTATRDVEVAGCPIRAGDRLLLLTGSAGRDETIFDRADEVVFERSPNRHIMFGLGPHRCAGLHLARMELRVALEEIHRVIPTYEAIPDRPAVRHTGVERGTDELWLRLRPSGK
jgi:cytochrome P450